MKRISIVTGVGVATFLAGCTLLACLPSASPADVGITQKSADHMTELTTCMVQYHASCIAYNECQQTVARKYGLPVTGHCTDTDLQGALDAGLQIDAGLNLDAGNAKGGGK